MRDPTVWRKFPIIFRFCLPTQKCILCLGAWMSGLCQGASPQPRSSATIITMLGGGEVKPKGRRKRLDERMSNMVVNLSLILCVRIGTPYIREVKSNWSYINCCAHKAILSWLSFSSKWWVFDIRHPLVRNNVASAKRHQKMASAGQLLLCGENFTRKSPNEFRPQVNFVQTSAGGLKHPTESQQNCILYVLQQITENTFAKYSVFELCCCHNILCVFL